jgi:hypothetical protein
MRLDSYERRLLCTRRWRLMDKGIVDFLISRLDKTKRDRDDLERNCPLHGYVHPGDLQRSIVGR